MIVPGDRLERALGYGLAAVIGILAVIDLMPLAAVLGTGDMWTSPPDDIAQQLGVHLAFQADAWHVPPLLTTQLMWPQGVSIELSTPTR